MMMSLEHDDVMRCDEGAPEGWGGLACPVLRAGWMAQELLSTFGTDLRGGVRLIPDTGGVFRIHCNGALIWDRKRDGGFPDMKLLKQRVRDLVDPSRDLGDLDRKGETA